LNREHAACSMSKLTSYLEDASNLSYTPSVAIDKPSIATNTSNLIIEAGSSALAANEISKKIRTCKKSKMKLTKLIAKTSATKKKHKQWKKPKDKPKRPLSGYNLFFQHMRRELIDDGNSSSNNELIDSINSSNNNEENTNMKIKRRHRKTHGKFSFSDLARTIAEKWKNTPAEERASFEAQAVTLKATYKEQVNQWKQKRDSDIILLPKERNLIENALDSAASQPPEEHALQLPLAKLVSSSHATFTSTMVLQSRENVTPTGDLLDFSMQNIDAAHQTLMPVFQKPLCHTSSEVYFSHCLNEDEERYKMWCLALEPTPLRENATTENVGSKSNIYGVRND